jgi:hypothetical protein
MPRYRLAIDEHFAVCRTTWVELDAASPEEAEELVTDIMQYITPGELEILETVPELQATHVETWEDEDETYQGREVREVVDITERPGGQQGRLLA